MSEEYQTIERNREEGSIGIGAMIVFIALILVAAVASTIIIKTAEELQQNAEQTSSDTRKEISGKINIIQALVNTSDGTDVDSMVFTAKIASGSTNLLVNNIDWVLTCGDATGSAVWFLPTLEQTRRGDIADLVDTAAADTWELVNAETHLGWRT